MVSMTQAAIRTILDLSIPVDEQDSYVSLPDGVQVRRLDHDRYLVSREGGASTFDEYGLIRALQDIYADTTVTADDVRLGGWSIYAR